MYSHVLIFMAQNSIQYRITQHWFVQSVNYIMLLKGAQVN